MAFSLGEYQDIFLEEADEQLQELNQNLLELERDPDNIEIINNIFRAAHSLKSSAAFVGLNDLSDLAHKMENLLQGIRDKTMTVTPDIVEVIFKCFDVINSVIETVSKGEPPSTDLTWIIKEIEEVSESANEGAASASKQQKSIKIESAVPKTLLDQSDGRAIREGLDTGRSCIEITVFIDPSAQMKWVKAQLVLSNLGRIGKIIRTFPSAEKLTDDDIHTVFKVILVTEYGIEEIKKACNVDLIVKVETKSITLTKKDDKTLIKFGESNSFAADTKPKSAPAPAKVDDHSSDEMEIDIDPDESSEHDADSDDREDIVEIKTAGRSPLDKSDTDRRKTPVINTVKVSVDKLDLLLNNVAELVIANSGFYKLYEEIRKNNENKAISNEFKNRMEQMSRIAKDLQTGIMKTRMVQIGQIFNRFNRLVRDLAKEHDKKVQLIIKGEETELDKKVIDSIGEPLLHLIRNAIDHGIEPAEDRKRLGKTELARITLNSYQGGNQIFVEVSDDGKGLNLEKIKKKALERNLATSDMLSSMDNSDIFNFIFMPGFSTADKITDVSGRGVGMNVVREIVSELNGSVAIETEPGMGTRFVLAFPLTLAIIPAIMVKVKKEMYAIPLSDVIETVKISSSDITTIEGHEVLNFRGEILSLLRLSAFIKIRSGLRDDQKIPVVVVGFGNRKIGLMVDQLEGKQEIVIKSLEQNYRTVDGLAGASILGDGSICLILDIASMINRVISDQDRISRGEKSRILELDEAEFEEIEEEQLQAPSQKNEPAERVEHKKAESTYRSFVEKESAKETKPAPAEPSAPPVQEKTAAASSSVLLFEPPPAKPAKESDEDINKRVHDTLNDFRKELKQNVSSLVSSGSPSSHMTAALNIKPEDVSEFRVIANIGAANSAESLSKILNKRIDLTIPDVSVKPIESIPEYLGSVDTPSFGVLLPIMGEGKGTILFSVSEDIGFTLVDMLYGANTHQTRELTEDGSSALQEITNIIGSSIINVFAEKTGMTVKPGLPNLVHDYMESIIDSILVLHNIKNDYAIVMDTAFYFEDDRVIGNLMILPDAAFFKRMVEKLRVNA